MKYPSAQESISELINIDTLLGRLNLPQSRPLDTLAEERKSDQRNQSFSTGKWPRELLSIDLKEKIISPTKDVTETLRQSLGPKLQPALPSHIYITLDNIFEILLADVSAAREQLLLLNPGRRKLLEHRLEFIARKIARGRGERWSRSIILPEVLKDSFREDTGIQNKIGVLAWKGFAAEVALYQILELFFLKCLEVYGWRRFEAIDLSRMNFAAHTFLNQRAAGFAYDKHCWNFVRTNVYSWYVPSPDALNALSKLLDGLVFSWSDHDLLPWVLSRHASFSHLDFVESRHTAPLVLDLLEEQLGASLVSNFQGRPVCKKFFFPALELGGIALSFMDRLLAHVRRSQTSSQSSALSILAEESLQLHRAIWGCESESFEAFWIEVLALLKIIRSTRTGTDCSQTDHYGAANPLDLNRLPHAFHVVQLLGLELHNLDQLPLSGAEITKLHQGSAGQIQQIEAFDGAVVTDHPDRLRSSRWMKALAEQLPYWRYLISAGTNLNWGELHLFLALSKLKENSCCVYLSHRVLPDGGDGDKLRRAILGLAQLECFVELTEEDHRPYRYLYVFRRVSDKLARDQHRPRFGQLKSPTPKIALRELEEANSSQSEIIERGWDHLFVRGAAPLIRHLNHKFPKLFQLATVQPFGVQDAKGFFSTTGARAIEIQPAKAGIGGGTTLIFTPVAEAQCGSSLTKPSAKPDSWFIFPHNSVDLPWISSVLNSAAVQFWIRHQLASNGNAPLRNIKFQDLRSCPIVDLSRTPSDVTQEAMEWLGVNKPNADGLRAWACKPDLPIIELHARYVAIAKRYASLERIVARYEPLFSNSSFDELKPDAVTRFYPTALLCYLSQSPDIRIQYVGRDRCGLLPDNWTIEDIHSVVQAVGAKSMAYTIVHTRQGPTIQILMPAPIREYLNAQLTALRDHSWAEVVSLLRIPRDVSLFAAQTGEIRRVIHETAAEMKICRNVLEQMSLELFEIPADVRQFLPH